jgi:hypothetical protein
MNPKTFGRRLDAADEESIPQANVILEGWAMLGIRVRLKKINIYNIDICVRNILSS